MFLDKIKRRTVLGLAFSFAAFASVSAFAPVLAHAEDKTSIKLGTMEGEESEVWKVAAQEAKKQGLNIDLVFFSDYALPNEAVNAGDIDANSFQHKPYLDAQVEQRGYKLSVVGYTVLFPMGVYSHKIKDLKDLRDGAVVGVPNDPSNGGRALRLLNDMGFIKLKDPKNVLASKLDIVENPKKLEIRELDAGMLGRAIDDFDIAIVNTNWALTTGLKPDKDAIAWEKSENNPYNNIIVVRTADKDEPWVKKLVAAYNSEPVRAKIKEVFGVTAQPLW
ncbi:MULTISPECIES: MetQ/NlpA family ABC transporter substrate-binding protein [Bartonella]|uniref:MetQ/NlpA family ABC transporter substrate-binding protein n=1 Tax=Bartonella TaxID=773 RepID=UPI0018DCA015|nr:MULTISPECIES: MetQ/NlpA family ABC transporter substrate-binding protein [Bartonella]MBH9995801.1 MetQ/NlpA family ABC transporter substrate-binding protein [Bartonella sp. P0291]MBH9997962.1 MetQ/NlpA family ABC transporter substrate-binding protein [Bartonella sp. M0192]MBI0000172.1 MetQ/NlpA family ABC transporter substrate-binding protein [Bartonella sp. M0191]MBI0008478.1 MetQ/NlpA family ABC transporter substrate-binding protein [Bartonella sp. M0193]MBI0011463.1 MetQ/NlpA family ABC 